MQHLQAKKQNYLFPKQFKSMSSSKNSISDKLRSLRAGCGLSQECVANQLRISQKTYSRWENEADAIPLCTLSQICSVLGADIHQLIGSEPSLTEEVQHLRKEVVELQHALSQFLPPPY
ncbi:MAG: XRE family transcriptional regulator [Cytophagales bacterium]|nr:MAG: XRE family transcriptional regulator [Cytophagales bacterium]